MSAANDIERLRRFLDELAAGADDELRRYELRHPRMPPGLYWQARWLAGRVLRALESIGIKKADPWPAGLKQLPGSGGARPLLLWAEGTDPDTLRAACRRLEKLLSSVPGYAVVLVTNVADFAFFSRLGWLVEYLPDIEGEGEPYARRKARFLARLYRGAPALPVTAVLAPEAADELGRWLGHTSHAVPDTRPSGRLLDSGGMPGPGPGRMTGDR